MTSKPAISIEDRIYYAGLIDGEGYLFLCVGSRVKSKIYIRAGIKVAMVDGAGILERAKELWGGYLKERRARSVRHRNTKEWIIDGSNLDKLLPQIIPYLRLKKQQAEILVEFRSMVSKNNMVGEHIQNFRLHLMDGLKGLHHSKPFAVDKLIRDMAIYERDNLVRHISEETRRKLSESHKGVWHRGMFQKGCSPWTKGRKLSEEHKRKIGEANRKSL